MSAARLLLLAAAAQITAQFSSPTNPGRGAWRERVCRQAQLAGREGRLPATWPSCCASLAPHLACACPPPPPCFPSGRVKALVRTRVEPKTFFANERTFLQWLQIRWGQGWLAWLA